jgi:hypothetical protein
MYPGEPGITRCPSWPVVICSAVHTGRTGPPSRWPVLPTRQPRRLVGDPVSWRADQNPCSGLTCSPPQGCPHGHRLRPGAMLVGHQPCSTCRGGHTTRTCLDCGGVVKGPPLRVYCRILAGPAAVR